MTFKTEIRSGNVDQAATLMNEVVSSTNYRLYLFVLFPVSHDIADILLKLEVNTNQSINQSIYSEQMLYFFEMNF